MKLQLLIFSILMCLVLTNQEGGKEMTTLERYSDLYDSLLQNLSLNDYGSFSPCSVSVPGFNSLALMIVYIIVFVFSVAGNSVVVYVVCNMKNGRGTTDIYLMHLAIADLVFSITLPFVAVDKESGWIFGNFLCKVMSGFQEVSVYSSVFLLVCISVDRHFAIVRATRPMSSHHLLVKVACSVVWVVAGLLSVPVVIQKESMYAEDLSQNICYENLTGESDDNWRVSVRILRHTMGFFLPLVVMAVCYGWTLVTLLRHTRNQKKHKAIRVILSVVIVFVLCWLPYNIATLIETLIQGGSLQEGSCENRYILDVTLHVTEVLAFTHCAVNPVLYAFIGQKFRNQLLTALYRHGLISSRIRMAYRKGSANSTGSTRITSATM